jgi:hypothetical protein
MSGSNGGANEEHACIDTPAGVSLTYRHAEKAG